MDKVFSTRLDENLIRQINQYVKERPISKKRLIELSVRSYLNQVGTNIDHEIIDRSFGAWKRPEQAKETWVKARQKFNESFSRYSGKQ